MQSLALNGGNPVRESKISYGRQYIDEDDIKAVSDILRHEPLTTGPMIGKCEEELCRLTGAKYAVLISNGTAALHAACYAAGIGSGDEVIVSPLTFAASANCVLYCGGTPVFADINEKTWNISPESIESLVTEKTKAIIAVDFTGQAVQLNEIQDICKRHNLILIEDAAHSIGTMYHDKYIGNIADLTTFSFHPVKTITSGEGGAILTNNKEYYDKLIRFRSHGITREPGLFVNEWDGIPYYEQIELGYNYRMTDIQAALLKSQFNKINIFAKRRFEIVDMYNKAFADLKGVEIQTEIPESKSVRHLYILRFKLDKLNTTRKQIYDALYAENICCNIHYIPVYYHPYYTELGYKKGLCPIAEQVYEEILTLPLYYSMTDQDVLDVINAVKKVVSYYGG